MGGTSIFPNYVRADNGEFPLADSYVSRPIFPNKLQFDVVTVLLLLGEATIWKSIWTRFRFKRAHWKQWIFAIAPGWAPLSGSIFAAMQGSRGPPNLVYDRAPHEVIYPDLQLTNLNSGASHRGTNVIIQNVWQAWYNGPRKKNRKAIKDDKYYTTKEVGIVDVDISKMSCPTSWTLWLQSSCLLVQLVLSLALGLLGLSLEVLITFLVSLAAQALLLIAITPRASAWDFRDLTSVKVAPVMLHSGTDTTSILFVRCAIKDGQSFSLEEYSYESQTLRTSRDVIQLLLAGASFCVFAFQLILVSWMSHNSRLLFLLLGVLGLITNALESAVEPNWDKVYRDAFVGEAFCEPEGSSLMAAVGVLLGGRFSAAISCAKMLYPDNKRFEESLSILHKILAPSICDSCAARIRSRTEEPCVKSDGVLCCTRLARKMDDPELNALSSAKKIKDAISTVSHYLSLGTGEEGRLKLETDALSPREAYSWNGKAGAGEKLN